MGREEVRHKYWARRCLWYSGDRAKTPDWCESDGNFPEEVEDEECLAGREMSEGSLAGRARAKAGRHRGWLAGLQQRGNVAA